MDRLADIEYCRVARTVCPGRVATRGFSDRIRIGIRLPPVTGLASLLCLRHPDKRVVWATHALLLLAIHLQLREN